MSNQISYKIKIHKYQKGSYIEIYMLNDPHYLIQTSNLFKWDATSFSKNTLIY